MLPAVSSLLWFAAIVVMIPAALWLLKRTPLGTAAGQAGLRSVAVLVLAPGQRIVTLEVGSGGERRWLVLGVTPQSITTLHSMAPQGDAPAGAATPATASFAQLLGRWQPKDKP